MNLNNYLLKIAMIFIKMNLLIIILYYCLLFHGDWGLGIGDWGLGIGPNHQSPIPIFV